MSNTNSGTTPVTNQAALPSSPRYRIGRTKTAPPLTMDSWGGPGWSQVPALSLDLFHPRSSDHHPRTQAKLLHDGKTIHVFFRVEDRYVLSTRTAYHDNVCRDACVEFFVQPRQGGPYFNFEINCGGTILLYCISTEAAFPDTRQVKVDPSWLQRLDITASMPKTVETEITEPVTWSIGFRIPVALFEAYDQPIGDVSGKTWRGNFYKCASDCSHPHWMYWAPIGEPLSFHKPHVFAPLEFEA